MKTMSNAKQRQMIGYLRKLLGLSDDIYHDILWSWGVDTSKELSAEQAEVLINQFKEQAIGLGKYEPKAKYKSQRWKYNNYLAREDNMASPAQLRMIEALWFQVSNQTTDTERENALNKLSERVTGKSRLIFLTKKDVSKLIKALNVMKLNKEEKKNAKCN